MVEDEPSSNQDTTSTSGSNKVGDASNTSKDNVESVPYQELVTIMSTPNNKGKLLSLVATDDSGKVILLCKAESSLKGSFLTLKPEDILNVTGQLRENGDRFVLVQELELVPF